MPTNDLLTFNDLVVAYARVIVWDHVTIWPGEIDVLVDLPAMGFLPHAERVELFWNSLASDVPTPADESDWAHCWFELLWDLFVEQFPEVNPKAISTMLAAWVEPDDELEDDLLSGVQRLRARCADWVEHGHFRLPRFMHRLKPAVRRIVGHDNPPT
jgi:hypothetical protein